VDRLKTRVLPFLAALLGPSVLLSCADPEAASDFPEIDGWTQPGAVLTYDADTLWEYINGAAELFVEFGVETCRTTDLTAGDVTVTVDLYDMGTPLGAFGVYEQERPQESMAIPGAVAGVVSPPYQALLLKGSTYVKVNTFEGELTEASGLALLEALASALDGDTSLPAELALLPQSGKIAGTEGYKRRAFLGQTELTECVYAEYAEEGGEPWQGFAVLPGAAASVWGALEGAWDAVEGEGGTVRYTEIPYVGWVGVVRTDAGVFGVSGAADQAEMLARLEGFVG
jgi:hypothetical protein